MGISLLPVPTDVVEIEQTIPDHPETETEELPDREFEEHEVITGRQLARLRRRLNPSERALLADDLRTGKLMVMRLTAQQAECLAQANHAYVSIVRGLSDEARCDVRWGFAGLAQFVKAPTTDHQANA
jgi:hypothetical protein